MTQENPTPETQDDGARRPRRARLRLRLPAFLRRLYGPWARSSGRLLDWISANDGRRRRTSVILAISINLIVLTLMSTFARVRIWIPNAPSDTIQITLVEPLPFDISLRDPDLEPVPEPEEAEPEPEPEPEIVEEPEPEPEPEPDPIPEPPAQEEPEPEPAPEPEPEIEQPEPEPQLDLELEPQFAPETAAPEPLIPDPAPAAEDDLALPEPLPAEEEQAPEPEADEPLVSVEPESQPRAGLEDIRGDDETDGEDETTADQGEEEETEEPAEPEEPPVAEAPSGDDMFDEEPVFGRRSFVLPQVALPSMALPEGALPEGEAAIAPGSSGVVAIFCPEHFTDEEKQKECAGRPEIRSGWRPGASGEDWSRATELLKRDRDQGVAGPSAGPVYETLQRRRDFERVEELRDFRRSQDDVNNLPDAGDDNIMRGVEGNRPNVGPAPFEPSWTLRENGELSQKEIEELKKQIREQDEE